MDSYAADADAVAEQAAHYTEDKDIEEDFAERQQLAASGRDELLEELDEHNFLSPEMSGGDLDASWQTATVAGEETVGGSAPTPDQDLVDELGAAAGIRYADDEPLNSDAKILDRDRNRWELNPASADDEENEDDLEEEDELEDVEELEDLDELDREVDEEEETDEDDEDEELGHDDLDDDELIDAELEDEEDDDV